MNEQKKLNYYNLISFIFNPENVVPLLLVIFAFKSFSGTTLYWWILLIVLFNFLFNYIWLFYLSLMGVEVDKPLEKGSVKSGRILAIIPQLLVLVVELIISNLYGQYQPFHSGIILFLLGGVLFSIVTYYWKISAHAATTASLFTALSAIVSVWFLFSYLFVPVIFLSRKKLHRHTNSQLVIGNILGIVVTLMVLNWYGLIN